MKTPEIDKLISTLEYQVNIELFMTPKKVELLEELKKLKEVKKCSVLDDVSSETELFENMQYYMEHCKENDYVSPKEWIEKHKSF